MKKLLWMALLLCAGLALASITSSQITSTSNDSLKRQPKVAQGIPDCPPLTYPDLETIEKWTEEYENAPRAYIRPHFLEGAVGANSVLHHLCYVPDERRQGCCNNCWAWVGTGCLEIALDVREGVFDRLSIQYINSCQFDEIGKACCAPGSLNAFANFYTATEKAIPWANDNADWQDGDESCDTDCDDISDDPYYEINSVVTETITTHGVGLAIATANIKNIIDQDRAIYFSFYLPQKTDCEDFFDFWYTESEGDVWDFTPYSGGYWDEGAWHAVLCVGYNDLAAPPYWEMVNSWGTTPLRPNDIFRVKMDMNYDMSFWNGGVPYYMLNWQTLAVDFGEIPPTPTPTITPTPTMTPTNTPTITPTPPPSPTPTITPTGPTPTPTETPTITPTPTKKPHGPWPKFRYGLKNEGFSKYYDGPMSAYPAWSYRASESVESSPAVGFDGKICIGSHDNVLYVLSSSGAGMWSYATAGNVTSSPAISAAQEIYVGSKDNRFYAFDSTGGLKWSYTHPGGGEEDTWASSPVINDAGEIYAQARSSLMTFNSTGSLAWSFSTGAPSVTHPSSPAVGDDGKIFWGTGNVDTLYAINSNSSLAWSYRTRSILRSSPAIGLDGKIVIGCYDNNLYAFTSAGALYWSYLTAYDIASSPAIGPAEEIYVGSRDNRLYALTSAGAFLWSYEVEMDIDSSPAIGVTGKVYVGTQGNILYAFNYEGTLLWSYVGGDRFVSSPAIGAPGRVYVGSSDNNIYALGW